MAAKKYYVEYEFPELPSGQMYQNARVEATNLGMACHRAFQVIKARPHVKGRRIHNAKIRVVESISSKSE